MNVHFTAPRRKWPNRLVNLVVVLVVLALAAATFVLSYSGVHAIVLQAGVSARFARIYPGLFDAVFVIACVAAVTLRDARWWARWYAWLVIILMVAVVGAADAVHAMSVTLPHRTIEGVVAAVPWVLVLLGFSLMLTMLRQSRAQHAGPATPAGPAYVAPGPAELPEAPAPVAAASVAAAPVQAPAPVEAAAPRQETRALPVGTWVPVTGPEPEGIPVPDAAQTAETAAVPEAAETAETAAVPDAAVPEAAEVPAEAGQPAGEDAAAYTAAYTGPIEFVEPEPVHAQVPYAEPVAPYDYWDSGVDSGYPGPGRVPTVSGEVIDDGAPPFATVPFAAVPRLNRVRSSPTPPEDDDEEE